MGWRASLLWARTCPPSQWTLDVPRTIRERSQKSRVCHGSRAQKPQDLVPNQGRWHSSIDVNAHRGFGVSFNWDQDSVLPRGRASSDAVIRNGVAHAKQPPQQWRRLTWTSARHGTNSLGPSVLGHWRRKKSSASRKEHQAVNAKCHGRWIKQNWAVKVDQRAAKWNWQRLRIQRKDPVKFCPVPGALAILPANFVRDVGKHRNVGRSWR